MRRAGSRRRRRRGGSPLKRRGLLSAGTGSALDDRCGGRPARQLLASDERRPGVPRPEQERPLDPYEDRGYRSRSGSRTCSARMTLEEKAGLLFHRARRPRRRRGGDSPAYAGPPTPSLVGRARLTHFNVYWGPSPRLVAEWHNRLQEAGREHAAGHPGDDLVRSAPRLQRQPGHEHVRRAGSRVARADRAGGDARRGAGARVRRHRPAGVPGGRHPRRAASDGRPRHRAALGPRIRHLRRGCRARRAAGRARTSAASRARRSARRAWPA